MDMKTISCLIAALVVVVLLTGVPNAMSAAYDTGEGHGYASCASTEIVPNGTIFRVVRIQPGNYPTLCSEFDRPQRAVLFQYIFGSVAYCLPGMEI